MYLVSLITIVLLLPDLLPRISVASYSHRRQPKPHHLKGLYCKYQGIGIKGREMALVWHEKASPTALQTGSLLQKHTLLEQTHTHDYSQGKCRTMSSIIMKLE